MKRHAVLTVAPNSFIQLGTERHHYSVPNRLIGYKVEVVFTSSQVRIFHNGSCVATRPRSIRSGGYTYDSHHLPSQTQQYYAYSPQYFIDKGTKYGETVKHVLRELFSVTDKPAEIYYRSAQGILALAKETGPKLFNMACSIAVKYDKCNYKFISNLVKSKCQGYLALQNGDMQTENIAPTFHSNIRGPQAFK